MVSPRLEGQLLSLAHTRTHEDREAPIPLGRTKDYVSIDSALKRRSNPCHLSKHQFGIQTDRGSERDAAVLAS